jgi:hypothetical protein
MRVDGKDAMTDMVPDKVGKGRGKQTDETDGRDGMASCLHTLDD